MLRVRDKATGAGQKCAQVVREAMGAATVVTHETAVTYTPWDHREGASEVKQEGKRRHSPGRTLESSSLSRRRAR